MTARRPTPPLRSNDPKGERPAPPPAPPRPTGDLAELDATLTILRKHDVASYQREADGKVTINLWQSPRVATRADEAKEDDRREESVTAWERKMKFGAAGGMRGPG